MEKTTRKVRIRFDEIQSGDRIEVENTIRGVTTVRTGVAMELWNIVGGDRSWKTHQEGDLTLRNDHDIIHRIEPWWMGE